MNDGLSETERNGDGDHFFDPGAAPRVSSLFGLDQRPMGGDFKFKKATFIAQQNISSFFVFLVPSLLWRMVQIGIWTNLSAIFDLG